MVELDSVVQRDPWIPAVIRSRTGSSPVRGNKEQDSRLCGNDSLKESGNAPVGA